MGKAKGWLAEGWLGSSILCHQPSATGLLSLCYLP